MTARELAEKIASKAGILEECIPLLESLLAEALAECKIEMLTKFGVTINEIKECAAGIEHKARAAAYEECAKIADEHNGCRLSHCQREPNCSAGIAYQIRRRAGELK